MQSKQLEIIRKFMIVNCMVLGSRNDMKYIMAKACEGFFLPIVFPIAQNHDMDA